MRTRMKSERGLKRARKVEGSKCMNEDKKAEEPTRMKENKKCRSSGREDKTGGGNIGIMKD
jgi:hypothetical protein